MLGMQQQGQAEVMACQMSGGRGGFLERAVGGVWGWGVLKNRELEQIEDTGPLGELPR